MAVSINTQLVLSRLASFVAHFQGHRELYGGAGALVSLHGKKNEQGIAQEPFSVTLQRLFLGYEFPDTLFVVADGVCYFHASAKKLEHLRPVEEKSGGRVMLVPREKGEGANAAAHAQLVAAITAAGHGGAGSVLADADRESGAMVDEVRAALAASGVAAVDATRGVEAFLAVKDDEGLAHVRKAGHLVSRVARDKFVKLLEAVLDEGNAAGLSNAAIASQVSDETLAELETTFKVAPTDAVDVDWTVGPLVQSGGAFSTQATNPANANSATRFSDDVILYSAVMKYKAHLAVVARTYLIDPSPSQLSVYESLLDAQAFLIDKLRPGAVISEVVAAVTERLMARAGMPPDAKLSRTFGSAIGARVTDKFCALSSKNGTVISAGMVFGVCMGLTDIPLADSPPKAAKTMGKLNSYALLLADTVVVAADGPPSVVTDKAPKEHLQVVYSLADAEGDEEDDDDDDPEARAATRQARREAEAAAAAATAAGRVGGRSTRLQARAGNSAENEQARKEREAHQQKLLAQKREAALKKGAGAGAGAGEEDEAGGAGDELANAPPIAAFAAPSEYPRGSRLNAIVVDKTHNAVLVPLFGTLVPFHISTIKSVVKSEEGLKAFLRLNFYSANQALGKDVAPSMAAAVQRHGESIFIRTLNFVSRDHRNLTSVEAQIKLMQKNARAARETAKQMATLVDQAKVILSKDKVPRLSDLSMWPAVSGRKTVGTMEAHVNGLRFTSTKGERVEITYANIRHAIFQPCEAEHTVLLHFHLRHAIILGKKKLKDVQFFTEVISSSQALDGRGRSDYDVDEYGEEERERKLRVELNRAFKRFTERMEEIAAADPTASRGGFRHFDVPMRDLAFTGAPIKEMVPILPCSDCLVSVADKPPFVVSNGDVDHVHFERVVHGGKNFDMVVIYKAGSRDKGEEEWARISAIPMASLETVKQYLDEVAEITFSESTTNYAWKSVLEDVVRKDDFYLSEDADTGEKKPAGWTFLTDEGWRGMGGTEDEGDDEDDESEFSEDDEDDDDDDDDEDAYADEDDSDASEAGDDDDDGDDADDWEELEKEAEQSDRKKRQREEEDEGGKVKGGKSSSGSGGGGGKSKSSAPPPPKKARK